MMGDPKKQYAKKYPQSSRGCFNTVAGKTDADKFMDVQFAKNDKCLFVDYRAGVHVLDKNRYIAVYRLMVDRNLWKRDGFDSPKMFREHTWWGYCDDVKTTLTRKS